MSLVQNYILAETSRDVYNKFWNYLGEYKKNTSGSYSSLKSRICLKINHGTLHACRYTEWSTDVGFEAFTLFHHVTDVLYPYVSVGVKLHSYLTISKHWYELAACFSRLECTNQHKKRYWAAIYSYFSAKVSEDLHKVSQNLPSGTPFCAVRFRPIYNKHRTNRYKSW